VACAKIVGEAVGRVKEMAVGMERKGLWALAEGNVASLLQREIILVGKLAALNKPCPS
jgi:hypothetical protein